MKPQFDFRFILLFVVLPMAFAAACSISALALWLLAPRRFRAVRVLLWLPFIGMAVGVPVALIAQARPDLVLWVGTSCMSVIMLIGFFFLGIATLIRVALGRPEPIKRPKKRRQDDFDSD